MIKPALIIIAALFVIRIVVNYLATLSSRWVADRYGVTWDD